jgi:MYXO-CTERM domain-containing protein
MKGARAARHLLRLMGVVGVFAGIPSCAKGQAPSSSTNDPVGWVASPLLGGEVSPVDENFVVRVRTGTAVLVSPTLGFMARHTLISDVNSIGSTYCRLGTISTNSITEVFVGGDVSAFRSVPIKRVIVDLTSEDCKDDIAAFELVEPVTGLSFPPLVLDVPPGRDRPAGLEVGAATELIGWGQLADAVDGGELPNPTQRQRAFGTFLGVDSGTVGSAQIPNGFLASSVHACGGDSGGAILDGQKALLAIETATAGPTNADTCAGDVTFGVPLFHQVAFVERAFQSIGRMPWRAGKPPPNELGGACSQDNDCHSNYCVHVGAAGVGLCSRTCSSDADCGTDLSCTDTGQDGGPNARVCLDRTHPPAAIHGCSVGAEPAPRGGLGLAFGGLGLALGVLLRRRARRSDPWRANQS